MDQSLRIAFLTNGHNNRERVMRVSFLHDILSVLLALNYSRCLMWLCYKVIKVAQQLQPFQLRGLQVFKI